MKKKRLLQWIAWVVICLSTPLITLNAQEKNKDWANLNRYAKENATLQTPAPKEKRVVFMGNSITEGWVGKHPEFFTANNYIGRGISGQTSYQFLVRFRQDVINLSPCLVVINAGTNDVAENTGAYNEDITFGNIVSMTELARSNKIKVVLTSVLPAASFKWNPSIKDSPAKIQALNARIQTYARENKIPYVDYYSSMVSDGDALNPAYSNDGVHPTMEGYQVMEALIKPVIDKNIK